MDTILKVSVLFAQVLALSFLVERFLEILKATYDLLDSRRHWYKFWERKTKKLSVLLEKKLHVFEYVDPKYMAAALDRFRSKLLTEQDGFSGTVPVLSGDLVRAAYIRLWSKVIGMILGIGLAFWMKIDLVTIWYQAAGSQFWVPNIIKSPNVCIVGSGIIMGLGSNPVHKIITTIERKQQEKEQKGVQS